MFKEETIVHRLLYTHGMGHCLCVCFLEGLKFVGHSFAFVAHFVFLRHVWI
jgi:hypothetical protein